MHAKNLLAQIQVGDTVTIKTHHGSILKGRAVMRSAVNGWVLNGGGRYGTPLLADNTNVIKVWKRRENRKAIKP